MKKNNAARNSALPKLQSSTLSFSYLVQYLVYADDLQVYVTFSIHRLQEFANIMSKHATHISNWATRNRLRLNIAKTKATVIGSYY